MMDNMGLHSCRICGMPLLRWMYYIDSHVRTRHLMPTKDYLQQFGAGGGLEETPEERRTNALAPDLECPICREAARGFHHMFAHMRREHGLSKVSFREALKYAQRQIGISKCNLCPYGPVLRDAMPLHEEHFHKSERNAKWERTSSSAKKMREERRMIGNEDSVETVAPLDEKDSESASAAVAANCKADQSCTGRCQSQNPLMDGCLYSCQECPDLPPFHTVAAVTAHVKSRHENSLLLLESVKDAREEKMTACKICGQQVVRDRIELGHHVWAEHGLPLAIYANCE